VLWLANRRRLLGANAASGTGTTNRSSTLEHQNTGTALTKLRSHTTNFGPHRLSCALSPATPRATQRPLQPANIPLRTHFPCPLAQDLCESARPLCQLLSNPPTLPVSRGLLCAPTCPCFTPSNGPSFQTRIFAQHPAVLLPDPAFSIASIRSLRLQLSPLPLPRTPVVDLETFPLPRILVAAPDLLSAYSLVSPRLP
jgi:hypothetical protein